MAVINLHGPDLRETIGGTLRDARRALHVVTTHRNDLLAAWRRIHG
jgi:hypothetical protein